MKTYSVRLLFLYTVENESRRFFEESIRLFCADSFDEAAELAETFAKEENYEYTNMYDKKTTYSFYCITDVFLLSDKPDTENNTEIFSVHFEAESNESPAESRYKSCNADDMKILRHK